jgi:hypothetical protein
MIDRRTFLICVTLIALMLAATAWRIIIPDDVLPVHDGAHPRTLSFLLFPACGAFVAGLLYWSGLRTSADAAKIRPWCKWGKFVSIGYCAVLLLLQGLLVVRSLGLHLPFPPSAVARTVLVLLGLMFVPAVNQMPKLPWLERGFWNLGPIYGPRYMRAQSRILLVFMIAVLSYSLALSPNMAGRPVLYVLLASAILFVQAIAWRRHLSRKWKLEQPAEHRV